MEKQSRSSADTTARSNSSHHEHATPLVEHNVRLTYKAVVDSPEQDQRIDRLKTWFLRQARLAYLAWERDLHSNRYALFAFPVILLTALLVVVYYVNHPQAGIFPDTQTYLYVVYQLQTHGTLANTTRVPGFPFLMLLVFTFAGQNNFMAVSIVNALLFILATCEIYVIALLVLRRPWMAALIALLTGINVLLLPFIEAVLTEALTLWLLVSLAMIAMLFIYTLQARYLWLGSACSLALLLTRIEWMYLPPLLFVYLLSVAAQRRSARRVLPHLLGSVLLLYALLGGYLWLSSSSGLAATQNINLWGKLLEYNMQDEAPPQYAQVRHIVDSYLARGITDSRSILDQEPLLYSDHYALAGKYAETIILHHPVEFVGKSIPLLFSSLTSWPYGTQGLPSGPFGTPLLWLQSVFRAFYEGNVLLPGCAALWIFLLCWQRTRSLRYVQAMGVAILLTLYGLIVTTLVGYQEFPRYHVPFSPLSTLIIWGSLLAASLIVVQHRSGMMTWLTRAKVRREPE